MSTRSPYRAHLQRLDEFVLGSIIYPPVVRVVVRDEPFPGVLVLLRVEPHPACSFDVTSHNLLRGGWRLQECMRGRLFDAQPSRRSQATAQHNLNYRG